jgi:hypothetical protein
MGWISIEGVQGDPARITVRVHSPDHERHPKIL